VACVLLKALEILTPLKVFKMRLLNCFAALALSVSTAAFASPITGSFNVGGGTATLDLNRITFNGIGSGLDFLVDTAPATRSGAFAQPAFGVAGNGGTIGDLAAFSASPDFFPVGPGATPRSNWLTLTARPTYNFTLTELVQGQALLGFPTPFTLTQSGSAVFFNFSVVGTLLETGDITSNTTRVDGLISAKFLVGSIEQATRLLITDGSSLQADSWSGTFTASIPNSAPVPVPATLPLLGLGLVAAAAYRRRSK
jgi:hypothetical protein